ncbi:NHL repeat containing protein [Oopsacas minuta]|uniref:NHL repeat containing protein n=1 Tax=Oopsacas minuta TaxID=111878 RepID=A0AAV7JLE0_9METZ|nr:NHL repeat containing protein [Oopsacas minuta]
MANYNAPGIAPVDDIEIRINELFDGLFLRLNQRRLTLIAAYHDLRDDKAARPFTRINKFEQLVGMKAETERRLQLNELRELQERVLADIEQELAELNTPQPETHIVFRAQSEPLEKLITGLGEVLEEEEVAPVVPKYDNMRQVVAVGKNGRAPGELYNPKDVTVDPNTNNIFVTEGEFYGSLARISIFSEKGDYLDSFTHQDMKCPHGIAIHGEYVYITDTEVDAVFCFKKRNDYSLITKVGILGTQIGEFNFPYSLSVSSTGDVYVADFGNNRIQILNSSLIYMRNLTEQEIRRPLDIKLTSDEVYVLCFDNPCVHVFSHTGGRLRSLISSGSQMEITDPCFFCLDPTKNILISDWTTRDIKIFSKEGNHIRTIQEEDEQYIFYFSTSLALALTKEFNLVVLSNFSEFPLRIFSCMNL